MAGVQFAPRDSHLFSKREIYKKSQKCSCTESQKYVFYNQRNTYENIWERNTSANIREIQFCICVCVLLGPVNNGPWCCCELRAGGRCCCLTAVWRCGSSWVVSAPPCLLLWTHTVVTQPAANLARPATHRKTGIAGEKCGRKYLKMEWIG